MFMEAASIDPMYSFILLRINYGLFSPNHTISMEITDGHQTGFIDRSRQCESVQVRQEQYFVVRSIVIGFLCYVCASKTDKGGM